MQRHSLVPLAASAVVLAAPVMAQAALPTGKDLPLPPLPPGAITPTHPIVWPTIGTSTATTTTTSASTTTPAATPAAQTQMGAWVYLGTGVAIVLAVALIAYALMRRRLP